MGGGMGISQGSNVRIVTERTRLATPETQIGLFPDVGGGYFLSRCPGHVGEYLALTGAVMGADETIGYGLADVKLEATQLPRLWGDLGAQDFSDGTQAAQWVATNLIAISECSAWAAGRIDAYFSLPTAAHIMDALEALTDVWAQQTAATLRKRSPLMLHVALAQIRRAHGMTLAEDLRMERDMVRHCFHTQHLGRSGAASETVEGIRALAVDKDHSPKWNPPRIEDVTSAMVAPRSLPVPGRLTCNRCARWIDPAPIEAPQRAGSSCW